ncbi:methyltransferase family protein [Pseudomonas sp. MF4836]|uniref:methyltransferase family protein n=1 Tax=Pseudomonas sp. MF4836 TaxID=1960827 RepID=UPI000996DFE1|nr:isoprenylcysteine carboxylmethyltransferase family protein [Pseudomonas sp. MF4836]OOV94138.1 isoprenylcysteine carboxyl methyltransferase [Pseudomonas sp. MF4836]
MARPAEPPLLPPPLLYLLFITLALFLADWLPLPIPANGWTQALAVLLIVVGQGLSFWAMWRFRKQHTTNSNFNQPRQLLRDGPFAVSRNPINLGDTCGYCAIALLLGSLWPWLLLAPLLYLMNRNVIHPDEVQLQSLFGDTYRDYCRKVRRWL